MFINFRTDAYSTKGTIYAQHGSHFRWPAWLLYGMMSRSRWREPGEYDFIDIPIWAQHSQAGVGRVYIS